MLTKTILVAILVACAAPPGAAANPNVPESTDPPEFTPPPEPPQRRETYWCCDSINAGKASGEGCEEILVTKVVLCDKVLHCSGDYSDDDGKVTCL
jgi:hypothetical protein